MKTSQAPKTIAKLVSQHWTLGWVGLVLRKKREPSQSLWEPRKAPKVRQGN